MKKLKYFLLAFVVLILIAGGYVLYELKFKDYDVADEKVDEILQEDYVVELPDGTVIKIGADGQILEETVGSTAVSNEEEGAEAGQAVEEGNTENVQDQSNSESANADGQVGQQDQSTVEASNGKPTVAQIKEKYRPAFTALEGQAKSRLSGLIGQAKSEFSAKRANGESISYGYFYNKYMGAASSMEASTDAAVKSLVSVVRKELEANGYSSTYADSFLEEYESTKAALRSSMMAEVKAAL